MCCLANLIYLDIIEKCSLFFGSEQCGRMSGLSSSGLVDSLLNCRHIQEAPNVLILHVTSFPFALQTQHTRISPYNEIHWPSAFNNVSINTLYSQVGGNLTLHSCLEFAFVCCSFKISC